MRDAEKTIGNVIDKQKLCYLAVIDEDGWPEIRAMMAPRRRKGIRTIWLSTNTSSQKVSQILANPKCCLYFCDTRFYRGFALKGTASICTDAETKASIWDADDTRFYPLGVEDPDYCVIRFDAEHGKAYGNYKTETFTVKRSE